MRLRLLPALLAVLLVGSLATTANANAIWSFTATFGSPVTTDTELLAGATLTATYQVPLPANYASFPPTPVAPINLALTSITIAGSGNAANNGTYAPTFPFGGTFLSFAPDFFSGGSAQVASDGAQAITLPSGSHLTFGATIPSVIAAPAIGSPVSLADFPVGVGNAGSFAPAVNPAVGQAETYFGTTPTFSLVPEPATLSLLGIGLAGLAGAGRRRPRRTQAP